MKRFYKDFLQQLMKTTINSISIYIICIFFSFIASPAGAQTLDRYPFRDGDFLFQDIRCGDLCTAIETVTPGWHNKKFSHLGLVCHYHDSLMVIEAIGKAVKLTPINAFLERSTDSLGKPRIVWARLKSEHAHLNTKAVAYAIDKVGTPYDSEFLYDNQKYYCSELIYDAYMAANQGKPFFTLQPMTFKDPVTRAFFPVWVQYYKDLKMEIPEGKPGCNPGGLANSSKIKIIRSFY